MRNIMQEDVKLYSNVVVNTYNVPYIIDEEEGEFIIVTEQYGIQVVDMDFAGISVDGFNITMGNKEYWNDTTKDWEYEVRKKVSYFEIWRIDELKDKLPTRYIIREKDSLRFACGMDLISNGMVWVGLEGNGMFFSNINNALSYLKDRLGDFEIQLEEPMRL